MCIGSASIRHTGAGLSAGSDGGSPGSLSRRRAPHRSSKPTIPAAGDHLLSCDRDLSRIIRPRPPVRWSTIFEILAASAHAKANHDEGDPIRIGMVGGGAAAGTSRAMAATRIGSPRRGLRSRARRRCRNSPRNTAADLSSNFEELVEDCDLLVIASPQQYHAPQADFALRAGVHVLERSARRRQLGTGHRPAAAADVVDEIYDRRKLLLFARKPDHQAIAKSGVLGDLYFGEAEYVHEMKTGWHQTPNGEPTWRWFWQVGKNGITYPTHSLGPLLQWMDDRITR